MANKVSFIFTARDQFTRVSNAMARSTKKVTTGLKGMARQAKRAQGAVRKAAAGIKFGFGQMVAAAAGFFGAKAFLETGMRFQDALADLSAITGATGKDLAFLSDETMRLAKESRIAQEEVAGAFKLVASAKSELLEDPRALSEVTKQVLLLKNATGMELADASKVALDALNQFGAGADQANRFVNVLAAGSKVGASEVFETGQAILKAGVAANLTGTSFEEMNALIQVLAKNGLKASEAGTGLQGALLKMETAGLAKIQPSVVGVAQAFKNLQEMQLDAGKMQKLFGLESIKAGGILINNADLVKQWTGELTGSNIAQQQADIRMRTFSSRMTGIGIAIKEKVIKAFIRLEPTLTRLATQFGKWIDSVNDQDILRTVAAVEQLALGLGAVAKFGAAVAEAFTSAGKAMGEFAGKISVGNLGEAGAQATSPMMGSWMGGLEMWGNMLGIDKEAWAAKGSRADVNVNLRAPEGVVESVKSRTEGNAAGMSVGVNMQTAGAM